MASVRDIRKRIKSVKSTQKITNAMKMVAAAKLRKAQEAAEKSNPYSQVIERLFADLSSDESLKKHPLFRVASDNSDSIASSDSNVDVPKNLLVIFSSDRGLCGSFNSSLIKKAEQSLKESADLKLYLIGKKANSYFGAKFEDVIFKRDVGFWQNFDVSKAQSLSQELSKLFCDKEFDGIDFLYNEFVSILNQETRKQQILPLVASQVADKSEAKAQASKNSAEDLNEDKVEKPYIFEPKKTVILDQLIPKALNVKVYRPCLHSIASEFGARMTAMDSATRNAGDMIDDLTLTMNRVRQANITRELVEIISGAEAIG